MNRKEITYQVNGVAISWWRHMLASKTFWVVSAFVLTAADRWNKGELSTTGFFQMVQIGVVGILIRTALTKAELAANAGNPDVRTVAAKERPVILPAEITGLTTCLVAAGAMLTLTACSIR